MVWGVLGLGSDAIVFTDMGPTIGKPCSSSAGHSTLFTDGGS